MRLHEFASKKYIKKIKEDVWKLPPKILEGGNAAAVDPKSGEVVAMAKPINFGQISQREFKDRINQYLKGLNDAFQQEHGSAIWKNFNVVTSGEAFNGSTELLWKDEDITTKDGEKMSSEEWFEKFKNNQAGDVDLAVPEVYLNDIYKILEGPLRGKDLGGGVVYLGSGSPNKDIGLQLNGVFKMMSKDADGNEVELIPQIDFEASDFDDDGNPTDFTKFSHSSTRHDVEHGVKGAFSKILYRAITYVLNQENIKLLTPSGREKRKELSPDEKRLLTFSVSRGLGNRYLPVNDPDSGEHQKDDQGRLVYREPEIKPSGTGKPETVSKNMAKYNKDREDRYSTYVKDVKEILSTLLKIDPENVKKDHYGFVKVLEEIKQQQEEGNEFWQVEIVEKIYQHFINLLFGSKAQEMSRDDPEGGDLKPKMAAVEKFQEIFSNSKSVNLVKFDGELDNLRNIWMHGGTFTSGKHMKSYYDRIADRISRKQYAIGVPRDESETPMGTPVYESVKKKF